MKLTADQYFLYYLRASDVQSLSYSSEIREYSSAFCDFQLITQNSSQNIASRQSRCIYVNGYDVQYRNNVEYQTMLNTGKLHNTGIIYNYARIVD